MWYEKLVDRGMVPDWALRKLIRLMLTKYSKKADKLDHSELGNLKRAFRSKCEDSRIALNVVDANLQHYELPTPFWRLILSSSMKYSGSIWTPGNKNLNDSDKQMLELYENRASISGGQSILDLGAGWGSLSLEIAQKYKDSMITSLTNSASQKEYIQQKATKEKMGNLRVVKTDISEYRPEVRFDRIVSIEMFEHIRNPAKLMNRIAEWLNPGGTLFIQVFSHKYLPHHFDDVENSWMAKSFFTGGLMPYDGFYNELCADLDLKNIWTISGLNYHQTLERWLENLDNNRQEITEQLRTTHTQSNAPVDINRYRLFLIICSELFRFNQGRSWHLMQYLFESK